MCARAFAAARDAASTREKAASYECICYCRKSFSTVGANESRCFSAAAGGRYLEFRASTPCREVSTGAPDRVALQSLFGVGPSVPYSSVYSSRSHALPPAKNTVAALSD